MFKNYLFYNPPMNQEAFIHKGSNKSNKIETLNSYGLKAYNMSAILDI